MSLYRNSIAVFGFALPTVITVVVVAAAFVAKGKVQASFDEKMSKFTGYKQNRVHVLNLERQLAEKRELASHWEELLSRGTASSVTSNLRQISEKLPSKEFQVTSQSTPPAKAGFGSASAQNSIQVKLGFRGTFRSMQKAFLELETRMPHLQLQELRISPGQTSNLSFDVAFTAWTP